MSQAAGSAGRHAPALRRALLALERMQARLAAVEERQREPIAIVGMGCRLPGGVAGPEQYWKLLVEGRDAIREVPSDRWDGEAFFDPQPNAAGRAYSRWGGFVSDLEGFDPRFFGLSPRESRAMDPQQRLVLEVAWEAIENAGIPRARLDGSSTGVFVGSCNSDYARAGVPLDQMDGYSATGVAGYLLAGRISYLFDLRGPSLSVDTACSSSAVAVHLACQSLRLRECDSALAGGVNLMLSPYGMVALARMRALSPDGRCKPFDARADGIARSEGCGVVVLKRLSDALADGDRIEAVIRGSAVNQDGRTNGITAPSGPAQQRVVEAALSNAGVEPSRIGYVETHGTGTILGDPIEVDALGCALGGGRDAGQPCVLGSAKANLGHLEAAAGVAGLLKAVLVLQRGLIPPQIHFETPNPHLSLADSPFLVPKKELPWPRGTESRCAGVSSFGFAGTNAHLILEEAPRPAARAAAGPSMEPAVRDEARDYLLPLSARSPEALRSLARAHRDRFRAALGLDPADPVAEPPLDIEDVVYTAGLRRTHFECRLAAVGRDLRDLADALDDPVLDRRPRAPRAGQAPPIAFVFSDAAAVRPEWFRGLLREPGAFREAIEACDRTFEPLLRASLSGELEREGGDRGGPDPMLRRALGFAIQLGLARLWRDWGIEPDVRMAEGWGEIAAACSAGALTLESAASRIAEGDASGPAPADVDAESGPPRALTRVGPGADALAREVERAAGGGCRIFVELGTGTGEARKGSADAPDVIWLSMQQRPAQEQRAQLLRALGRLYEAGRDVRWAAFFPDGGRCVALPSYPWQRLPHPLLPPAPRAGRRTPAREPGAEELRRS